MKPHPTAKFAFAFLFAVLAYWSAYQLYHAPMSTSKNGLPTALEFYWWVQMFVCFAMMVASLVTFCRDIVIHP